MARLVGCFHAIHTEYCLSDMYEVELSDSYIVDDDDEENSGKDTTTRRYILTILSIQAMQTLKTLFGGICAQILFWMNEK